MGAAEPRVGHCAASLVAPGGFDFVYRAHRTTPEWRKKKVKSGNLTNQGHLQIMGKIDLT
jgi:hypothetical protein